MGQLPSAVHRTIIAVDVADFTEPNRRDIDRQAARKGVHDVLAWGFAESGIDLDICEREDLGDGMLVLVPPTVSKSVLADRFPDRLVTALRRYNATRIPQAQLKLRTALHSGDIRHDENGWVGHALNLAFRILEAPEATAALREGDPTLALIVSEHFYSEVIQQDPGTMPESYRQIAVRGKSFTGLAWLRLLGSRHTAVPSFSSESSAAEVALPRSPDADTVWEVGTRGFGDRPPATDLLRRGAMIGALASVISSAPSEDDHDRSGPTVVALDGPWGIGKTSLVELVRRQLPSAAPTAPDGAVRPLRVSEADRALGRRKTCLWDKDMLPKADSAGDEPPLITARFEPWAHQTSEQVWAGLTGTLLGAVESTLLPKGAPATERYWFQRNLERVDRMRLRRALRKSVLSPLMAVSTLALAVPLIAALARSTDIYRVAWLEIVGSNIAVIITVALLLAALGHSAKRYFTRPASDFLPAELFVGPVPNGTDDETLHDPYHNAHSGYLYLAQHDVFAVLDDLKTSGHHMVVFVDDLDRCTPRATAEVFEAINMFVTRTFPITRFVLCLDMITVAAHLDHMYATLKGKVLHGDDPSPGWSFLRKLIQLPVTIPHIATGSVSELLNDLLDAVTDEDTRPGPAGAGPAVSSSPSEPSDSLPAGPTEREVAATTEMLEHHHQVRDRMTERLRDQQSLSVREAKRILTIWQYYLRVLVRLDGQPALVDQACHLIVLAEIISRWPAAQRALLSHGHGGHGLEVLAGAADDDWAWARAVRQLGLHTSEHHACTDGVRDLLRRYDGKNVAALAARLT